MLSSTFSNLYVKEPVTGSKVSTLVHEAGVANENSVSDELTVLVPPEEGSNFSIS